MKNKTTATFLSLLLGGLGIHKFYLGNNHFGIVYLLFCWTFIPSFIGVIEFFILVTMSDENFNKKYNKTVFESYMENTKTHNEPEINQLTSTKVIPQPLSSTHQQEHTSINEPFSYQSIRIQGIGLQILESINIISNTKNIDTLRGRFEFICKIYGDLVNGSKAAIYFYDIQRSIDEYKIRYYNIILNDFEISLIIKPNFSNLISLYSECIRNCFMKFYDEQNIQINQLKQQNAKIKRRKKIVDVGRESIIEMEKITSDEIDHQYRLQEIKDTIKKISLQE